MCNLLLTLVKHFNSIDFVYLICLFIRKIENSGGILIFWGEVANNTNIFSVQFPDKNVKRLLLPTQKKQDGDFFRHFSTIEKSYRREIDLQFDVELLEASDFIQFKSCPQNKYHVYKAWHRIPGTIQLKSWFLLMFNKLPKKKMF